MTAYRGIAHLRYWWAQFRHSKNKALKNPTFRVTPAIEKIRMVCPWLSAGSRVLDLGPRNTIEVGLLEQAGWAVEALDLFPASPRIRRGDMHRLPYPSGHFDLVFASHVLEHSFDFPVVARELLRVLKPGGAVWAAVPTGFAPSVHDRIDFGSAAGLLGRLPLRMAERVDRLWSEDRAGESRVLFRLRGNRPRIPVALVLLPGALSVRNWVGSGLVERLPASGWAAHLLVPARLEREVRGLVKGVHGVTVEAMESCVGGGIKRWGRRGPLRTASYVHRARQSWTYRHKLRRRWETGGPRSAWAGLEIALLRALNAFVDVERLAEKVEAWLPPSRAAQRHLEAIRPAVVVASTTIHEGLEAELFKSACRAGIPTVAEVATFDALVSKGAFLVRPDRVFVWGEQSAEHAINAHGFARDHVVVTGPPHYDLRIDDPPLSPAMILVAGTTVAYWQDEAEVVRELARMIREDGLQAALWYRPHPRRPPGQVEVPEGVVLDPAWARQASAGGGYALTGEAIRQGWRVLNQTAVLVTAWSTMIVEAALLGRPSVVIGYGAGVPAFGEWAHLKPVLTWPGVSVAKSPDDLRRFLRLALDGAFAADAETLRREANEIARALDRRARDRVIDALNANAGVGVRRLP